MWLVVPPVASTVIWVVPAGVPAVPVLVTVVVLPLLPQPSRPAVVPRTITPSSNNRRAPVVP